MAHPRAVGSSAAKGIPEPSSRYPSLLNRRLTLAYPHGEVSDMSDEQRIREKAYEIWEAKGRPEGQESEHWAQARDEMEPFYKEGDATAGSVESSVAIPMPKSPDKQK